MFRYIIYRILLFIPMLLVISLAAFYISLQEPRDPVDMILGPSEPEVTLNGKVLLSNSFSKKRRKDLRRRLNLDKPLFYAALSNLAVPDTLHKIENKQIRQSLHRLIFDTGNWGAVQNYHQKIEELRLAHEELEMRVHDAEMDRFTFIQKLRQSLFLVSQLVFLVEGEEINTRFIELNKLYSENAQLQPLGVLLKSVKDAYSNLYQQQTRWKLYVPCVHFYGWDNQYHHWLKGVITNLDFGVSYSTGEDVKKNIAEKIPWSFFFALISYFLVFLISLPLGLWTAYKKNSRWDRSIRTGLFTMDAIPSFWMGYLLILTFANTDVLNWFPAGFDRDNAASFVLPLIAYTYGSLAYLSRQVRINVLEVSQQEYIMAARSRGISESRIWFRHILKNALLPLITIFGGLLPGLVGGSVILEEIFAIPGMGRYLIEVIGKKDLPVIIAVFTLLGTLTMIGYLIADVLYKVVDPRVRLE